MSKQLKLDLEPANMIGQDVIDRMKEYARISGYKVVYRNRTGKQYVTVSATDIITDNKLYFEASDLTRVFAYKITRHFAPGSQHTSGGGTSHTFRINPETS